ncbi:MAG TPA: penicillin-binding protein activator [Candidatus Anaerobiospirillum pullistercoris]|uniref:Penicillin-binding protein activator n=1 Tax=Candidatus Anaerobiospirillum pullistercoris TaxID=2838452 RepID=A0A9D1WE19_9GAMM|nr:penicillin-binding protein activator [Candidatus Anaerobiospirillum pullistercoris]
MTVKSFKQRLKWSALAVALSLSLNACTSTTSTTAPNASTVSTTQAFSSLELSTAQYQAMVQSADADSRFPAMVLLARSAIVAQDYVTAEATIAQMKAEAITPLQQDEALLIEGLMCMHQGKNTDALFILNRINTATLPTAVASFYYQVSSNVKNNLFRETHRVEQLLQATNDRIKLLNYVNPETQRTVALQIEQGLQQLPASELTVQLNQNSDPLLKGFIEFALLDSSQSQKVKQQLVQGWQSKYPEHPLSFAAENLAAGIAASSNLGAASGLDATSGQVVSLKEGDRLAVLLPLSGRFAASVGEPARLGILAALQDRNSNLKVTFYDTNRMTMEEIASALGQNGTNFIIGPILKPEVDALLSTNITLPAIVFNQPASPREQLYYYNLGPDYEGALAASKIYHDGHNSPVVIAPESTRGQRAINGFTQVWQQANTNGPITCRYADINTVQAALTTCPLNNADAIYINATASDVIKVRGVLPDNTPLYLTDRSYMGLNHSSGELALAGAFLGDMPWLLTDNALKKDLMATLPQADAQVQRIFASAYDSINLAFNLERLHQDRADVLHGISGDLQIGSNGIIEMAPMWVRLGAQRPVN